MVDSRRPPFYPLQVPRLLEIVKLIRIVNCLLTMLGVGLGAYMAWLGDAYLPAILSAMAAFFVCAAGNVLNDLADIGIDRINRPERVLVRGSISEKSALTIVVVFNVVALAIAFAVNSAVTILVASAILLMTAYNLYLKKVPVLGNAVVALLGGLTFMVGGFASDRVMAVALPGPPVPAVLAFLLHLVREIVKDVEDLEGDRRMGIRTLPQAIGVRPSLLVALCLFFSFVILTYIPIFAGWFGLGYKIIAVYIIDLPMLALLIVIWGNPSQKMLKIGSRGLKFCMLAGIVALLLA
ncbi:MAG: geranylgeranylglycerol-phosphate geranylgeranyltransferase [candidate division Zixibacteria bacterium]|nr:geranylgeranylglycerol-phosphate geranylgeranyltransferase [candidate division Zixibacteria bacterium]